MNKEAAYEKVIKQKNDLIESLNNQLLSVELCDNNTEKYIKSFTQF